MRIAITGGLRFIGSRVVYCLQDLGHDLIVIDFEPPKESCNVELRQTDITNLNEVNRSLVGCDIVYHMAGNVLHQVRNDLYRSANVNMQGTLNILQRCVNNEVQKIRFASTVSVYNGLDSTGVAEENANIDLKTVELFGATKPICLCRRCRIRVCSGHEFIKLGV